MKKTIINHLHICSLVYCGNTNLAIKLFNKNLKNLISTTGFEYCKTFIYSLNFSIYNYILVKEGVSLHKCCFKNTIENYDYSDANSIIEIGHKIINSYSYCKDYLSEKYSHPEIKKAICYIHKHIDENISLNDICSIVNMNKTYFCRVFKTYTNYTFSEYVNRAKINAAKHLLLDPQLSLVDVSFYCGFNNYTYFCKLFKKIVGMNPLKYRNLRNKTEILDIKK
ncbi:AraC family transcriptional regulator [Clostridium septicum]|uniref:helix-turn-helix domain-containing protein n=1 Tax=Clostridium septicum TaxID=1504 RepID=UPI0032164289